MKYLFIVFFSFTFLTAQKPDKNMYSITYVNTFKDRLSSNNTFKEYSRLLVDGNSSIYQIYNVMKRDSLLAEGDQSEYEILNRYSFYNEHTIKINEDELTYSDVIFEDHYYYHETVNHNWTLSDEIKTIGNYDCKKATVTYGGRVWTAWYTLDVPINAGPYKFKGLPGLIVKLTDRSNSYDFELIMIVNIPKRPFEKYHQKKPFEEHIKTDRTTFNRIKANFEALSLNEKLNYGNTGPKLKLKLVGGSEDLELRNPKNKPKAKDLNLIEIDYKD
jgi:GLPGLI family protein